MDGDVKRNQVIDCTAFILDEVLSIEGGLAGPLRTFSFFDGQINARFGYISDACLSVLLKGI